MAELEAFFKPRSVAVIGASRHPEKVGHSVLTNLIRCGYRGRIYPVNPGVTEVAGLRCYRSVHEIPDPIDLAVITIPGEAVLDAARRCAEAGVRFLIVVSAGFKETGYEGLERERELAALCRQHGIRLLGPNCLGVIDTHTPLNVTFAPGMADRGEIAFISQSGALCVAILDWSRDKQIGFSKFISLGNKADLDEADFISAAGADPDTRVILCYLEDVASGEDFLRAAAAVSLRTPVIVLKAGRTGAGARAASSHTGALAGSDVAYDAAFRQTGVQRVDTMEELFHFAVAFATQPAPASDRIAIITNSGGPGIVTTDQVEARGLKMARLGKETIKALRRRLPPECNIYNPVDLIGSADAERYRYAMERVLADPEVDAALVLLTPTAVIDPMAVAEHIVSVREEFPDKPVLAAFMGGAAVEHARERLHRGGVPAYLFPEPAVAAIAGLVAHRRFVVTAGRREEEAQKEAEPIAVRPARVRQVVEAVRADGRLALLGSEAAEVVAAYGINVAPIRLAATPREAVAAAHRVGFPVVLKVASPWIQHKTDVGGVKIGLGTPSEVEKAFFSILESVQRYLPGTGVHGVEVQRMMPEGVELIVGMTRDVQFGPLLTFGLGGLYVNLLRDVSFRLATTGLARSEIRRMTEETKAFTLLRGFRGRERCDVEAVVDAIARLASLVRAHPEIAEIEINPLVAYREGVAALDVKATIS